MWVHVGGGAFAYLHTKISFLCHRGYIVCVWPGGIIHYSPAFNLSCSQYLLHNMYDPYKVRPWLPFHSLGSTALVRLSCLCSCLSPLCSCLPSPANPVNSLARSRRRHSPSWSTTCVASKGGHGSRRLTRLARCWHALNRVRCVCRLSMCAPETERGQTHAVQREGRIELWVHAL